MNQPIPPQFRKQPEGSAVPVIPADPPTAQPGLSDYFAAPVVTPGGGSCDPCLHEEVGGSPGRKLAPEFLDGAKVEELVLMGRCGDRYVEFAGDGVPVVENGRAKLSKYVPSVVKGLWHRFVAMGAKTVAAEPLPAPFLAVVNDHGESFALGGPLQGTATLLFQPSTKTWEVTAPHDVPKDIKQRLPETDCIQLTGHEPVPEAFLSEDTVRELKALRGTGLVFLEQIPVKPADCCNSDCQCCETSLQTVAKVIPLPSRSQDPCGLPDDTCYTLTFCNGRMAFTPGTPGDPTGPDTSLPQSLTGNLA